ncbi:MAG TPA: HemK/PrmC family methyltransferase [Acidimicrobiales bacterium]|jgi:release factor glutamine methyltransferase|nr:HemK/PrmC family methyltransferase [Acidimicrobiales bacterium]
MRADLTRDRVVARLAAAGCVFAHEEAEELVAFAPDGAMLEAWVRRREDGEPLPWITGSVEFCGRRLHIEAGVYVPRRQTEELACRAEALLRSSDGRALDLCTGCGAIAAHLQAAVPSAHVVGVDLDPVAARCARRNGVDAVIGHADAPFAAHSFDVVTAVPPYVPTGELRLLPADVLRYEPRAALDGGDDGLDLVRDVISSAARLLRPGGWVLIEIGGRQHELVRSTLATVGFDSSEPWFDDDGDLRGVHARATEQQIRAPLPG